jgi:hypothetical protein
MKTSNRLFIASCCAWPGLAGLSLGPGTPLTRSKPKPARRSHLQFHGASHLHTRSSRAGLSSAGRLPQRPHTLPLRTSNLARLPPLLARIPARPDPDLVLEDAHLSALRISRNGYTPLVKASEPATFSLLSSDFDVSLSDFVARPISSMPAPSLGYLVLTSWFDNPMQQPSHPVERQLLAGCSRNRVLDGSRCRNRAAQPGRALREPGSGAYL